MQTNRKEHGEPGHVNAFVRDHDHIRTHYGQHDRVVAFLPGVDGLFCRVDHKWGLGMPSVAQILDVAREDQGVGGKWVLRSQTPYACGTRTEFVFERGH